jgi:site-specific recombinase XerD
MEAVRLRVQDIDYQMKQLTVRAGKGDKDRFTTFPATLIPLLQNHLAGVKTLHQQDLARGYGTVYLPHALARKYPQAAKDWVWQYVFPAWPASDAAPLHYNDAGLVTFAQRCFTPPPYARIPP